MNYDSVLHFYYLSYSAVQLHGHHIGVLFRLLAVLNLMVDKTT